MDDEMIRLFIVVRVRPGEVVILTRRSRRIERSLGGLSEDVVNDLSKLCRRWGNFHSRVRAGLARQFKRLMA